MNFLPDEPPDSVYLSGMDPSGARPPLALPDLSAPVAAGARSAIKPARRPARPSSPSSPSSPSESPTQRLALLISRLLAAPTEQEARHIVQDGLRALVRCRHVAVRLLDDPPEPFEAANAPGAPVALDRAGVEGATGNGAHPEETGDAWLRVPILADHEVIGSLALEAVPGQRALTPAARAKAEMVAHVLAQRLAHLRLLALAEASPVMPPVMPPAVSLAADTSDALRLAGVCAVMPDAALVADEVGRVVAANSAFRQLFGLSDADTAPGAPSALPLKRAQQALVPLDPPVPVGPASTTRPRHYLQRAPVRRVLERGVRLILAADGTSLGRVVIYRDITDHYDATERKQRFLAAVAHELRTPLTSITGYAQLLLRELDRAGHDEAVARDESAVSDEAATQASQATMRERVAALAGQSARMTRRLRDMLDKSFLDTGRLPLRLERVEMARLVRDVIASLNTTSARHCITLQAPRTLMLRGDGARIEQIVRHVLENAIKFSPNGGDIHVTLRTRREAERVAWCVLRVRDFGAGVPAGLEEAIFAPFTQPETAATPWISGIGLGLPLSRTLARQHGGTLCALAGQRAGATFELCLPLAGPSQLESDPPPAGL